MQKEREREGEEKDLYLSTTFIYSYRQKRKRRRENDERERGKRGNTRGWAESAGVADNGSSFPRILGRHSWLAPPAPTTSLGVQGPSERGAAWRSVAQCGVAEASTATFRASVFPKRQLRGLVSHSSHLLKNSLSPPVSLCVRERARLSVSLCACLPFRGMQRMALRIPSALVYCPLLHDNCWTGKDDYIENNKYLSLTIISL